MSDLMTNVEIEDVLSSIRRLVSEDVRVLKERRPVEPTAPTLVLTPAQRVAEADADDAGDADTAAEWPDQSWPGRGEETGGPEATRLWDADAANDEGPTLAVAGQLASDLEDIASLEDTISELEAAVGGIRGDFEPDGGESDAAAVAADLQEAFVDEPRPDAASAADLAEMSPDDGAAPGENLALVDEDRLDTPLTAGRIELSAADVSFETAGSAGALPNELQDHDDLWLAEAGGETVDFAAPAAPVAVPSTAPTTALAAEMTFDAPVEPEPSRGDDTAGGADLVFAPPGRAGRRRRLHLMAKLATGEDAGPDEVFEGPAAAGVFDGMAGGAKADAPPVARDVAQTAGVAGADQAGDASANLFASGPEAPLDLDALRDMVVEIIHQELQGVLGERITRNVRKLVRREILQVLETRDLD